MDENIVLEYLFCLCLNPWLLYQKFLMQGSALSPQLQTEVLKYITLVYVTEKNVSDR